MDDGHVHPAQLEAVRGLEAQQAAANDDCMPVLLRRGDHRVGVGDVAISDHARQFATWNRQDHRGRSRREQRPVVRSNGAVGGDDFAADAVDLRDFAAEMERDAVRRIPLAIVQHDLRQRLLARQHRREQDPVVIGMRLGAENRDVAGLGRELQQLFQRADARHAVADHDETHFPAVVHNYDAFSTCACRR